MGRWLHRRESSATLAQCAEFKCERLYPKVDPATQAAFKDVDELLAHRNGCHSFDELAEFVAAGSGGQPSGAEELRRARDSLAFLARLPEVGFPSIGDIASANRILCGEQKRVAPWRTARVWIGRVAMERSVWVGASPSTIPGYMNRWRGGLLRAAPLSLRLAIAVNRLLHIHPFPDGNGRTTRWFALSVARAHPPATFGIERLCMDLWSQGAAFRLAASALVNEDEDWSYWFDEWIRCARGRA